VELLLQLRKQPPRGGGDEHGLGFPELSRCTRRPGISDNRYLGGIKI
jgi:hypothetical protein